MDAKHTMNRIDLFWRLRRTSTGRYTRFYVTIFDAIVAPHSTCECSSTSPPDHKPYFSLRLQLRERRIRGRCHARVSKYEMLLKALRKRRESRQQEVAWLASPRCRRADYQQNMRDYGLRMTVKSMKACTIGGTRRHCFSPDQASYS